MRPRVATWMALAAMAGALLVIPPATAGGGGGCTRPVTEEQGTTVRIRDACFMPTILRVEPGTDVTWTNLDGYEHDLIGANWKWHREEWRSETPVVRRFTEPGVYPYACSLHPGMVGAIVVGGAAPPGAVGTVAEVPAAPRRAGDPWGVGAAAFGLVALGLGVLLLRRRPPFGVRRRPHEPGAPS